MSITTVRAVHNGIRDKLRRIGWRYPEWWVVMAAAVAWMFMAGMSHPHASHTHASHTAGVTPGRGHAQGTLGVAAMVIAMMLPLTLANVRHVEHYPACGGAGTEQSPRSWLALSPSGSSFRPLLSEELGDCWLRSLGGRPWGASPWLQRRYGSSLRSSGKGCAAVIGPRRLPRAAGERTPIVRIMA
jgi:hypothetical protein